jgi:hypothetical protein
MAYNVLFISEQKLKDNSPITDNVDSSELRFAIQQSQAIQIQESLGTNLYEYLLQIVDDNTINTDAALYRYKGLLDNFIQPTLIAWSYYLALDNFWVKFMNIGLVQNRNEQGSPVDLKTLQYLKNNAKNQAEFQDNLLRRHLLFRSSWYPQYFSGNLNDGQLPPETDSAFKANISLPGWGVSYGRGNWNGSFNALGPLCAGSGFPTWYSSANNSPGIPKG